MLLGKQLRKLDPDTRVNPGLTRWIYMMDIYAPLKGALQTRSRDAHRAVPPESKHEVVHEYIARAIHIHMSIYMCIYVCHST